ncbi:restriction endonuclease subunit S [uncultured Brachyspira sp.]|nr:restriction endonuclease subunit S [uncultured Brachyspira sp.]
MNKIPNGWKEKKLKYIAEITSSKRIYEYEYVDSGIPFYRGKEITALKNNQKIENFIYISEKRYNELKEKYGVPSKYDILITAVGTVGNAYTIEDDKPFYFKDGNLLWLKNIKEYPKFVEYLFECNKNVLLNNFFGSVQHALTISRLENLTFYFPPLDEQKRIASALSKIDAYLENTIKLIEEKERFKRGIAKKLLTCKEGENIPEARFKGFEDEWMEVAISKIGTIITGNTPSTKNESFWNGNNIWVTPTDIKQKYISNSERKLTDDGLKKSRKLPANTLLITCIASIGKNAILKCEGACNQQINAIIPNKNYNVDFLYYLFENEKSYLKFKAPQSVIKIMSKSEFSKLVFKFPLLEEQEKIGGYLSLLDAEIDNLKKQKELIKEMKRGAMQKLLSGEVRLLE